MPPSPPPLLDLTVEVNSVTWIAHCALGGVGVHALGGAGVHALGGAGVHVFVCVHDIYAHVAVLDPKDVLRSPH